MSHPLPNEVVALIFSQYALLDIKPPPRQFTILAAFVLSTNAGTRKVVSLGTGSKCLPAVKLQPRGDVVHDSHAEILARRGAIRFFLEEIARVVETGAESIWIERTACGGKFGLRHGVRVHLYVSTPPCGDASTRYLAAYQDKTMAALKDSIVRPELASGTAARGRDNYSLYGVLRTKPGRADSPPTLSMSCSDKIASWSVLGIQGALASRVLEPVYVDDVILGEVTLDVRDVVREDCERALWTRLIGVDAHLPSPYHLHPPTVHFISLPFIHSKTSLRKSEQAPSSCNESLCWIADSSVKASEVLINGFRRGVPPKHRSSPKFRPLLSKVALFDLFQSTASSLTISSPFAETYLEAKMSAIQYQRAKDALRGPGCPFVGWVRSGTQWEMFYATDSHEAHLIDGMR